MLTSASRRARRRYGLKAKHTLLLSQLSELDAAEKAFSRKKVIVANEQPAAEAEVEAEVSSNPTPAAVEIE